MGTDEARYQIVTWTRERDQLGSVRNTFGAVLYDSDLDGCELPLEERPEAFRILSRANALCREHGPVAIGKVEGGAFQPMALLEQPVSGPQLRLAPAVPRRSLGRKEEP